MTPFLASSLRQRGSAALGGVALIATLVSLIITDLVSDGLLDRRSVTWLTATVIVWARVAPRRVPPAVLGPQEVPRTSR